MVTGKENTNEQIELECIKLVNVTAFTYLGSLLTYDNDCSKEIARRLGRATGVGNGRVQEHLEKQKH